MKLKSLRKTPEKTQTLSIDRNPFVDPPAATLDEGKVLQIKRDDPNTEVFSWGCDNKGQLGLGMVHDREAGNEAFNQP